METNKTQSDVFTLEDLEKAVKMLKDSSVPQFEEVTTKPSFRSEVLGMLRRCVGKCFGIETKLYLWLWDREFDSLRKDYAKYE